MRIDTVFWSENIDYNLRRNCITGGHMRFVCCIFEILKDWQTLVGSLLALGAAIWTIHVMRAEAKENGLRYKRAIERKKLAARAQMPDALSALSAYAREACRYLISGGDKPIAPTDAIQTLKAVIEYIDDSEAGATFVLVSWYQVQHARIINFNNRNRLEGNEYIYDVALLQSYVNDLFDYARNESQSVERQKPSKHEVENGLKSALGLNVWVREDGRISEVKELIARRHS